MNQLINNALPFAEARRTEQATQQGYLAAKIAYCIMHGQQHPTCRPVIEPELHKLRRRLVEISRQCYPFSIN